MSKTINYFLFLFCLLSLNLHSENNIPLHVSYTKIYDFLDELANDGIIEIQSTIKPYSRIYISQKLLEAKEQEKKLNNRQRKEVDFYLNDYAVEQNQLPNNHINLLKKETAIFSLLSPTYTYVDTFFKCRVTPIVGAEFYANENGTVARRWVGAEAQTSLGENLAIYGSLRDYAHQGEVLAMPTYLNNLDGGAYKAIGDNSEMRGGITYSCTWATIGLVKDHIEWGDNYHGSNIISSRAPSFPMIKLNIKPVKWAELNYIHGWLVSNVIDSTRYYIDNLDRKKYRYAYKYLAANMLTINPIKKLNVSLGNSIVYSETNIQPAYLIPFMFYKSVDHSLTMGTENQNSQIFIGLSSRNINHLHLYSSIYIDEIAFDRFKSTNPQANPISYKIGAKLSNFLVQNISLTGEYTHTNIINYKHSIPTLAWASNGYNLGSYLGDNSQEIYLSMNYKPIKGLDLTLSYLNAKHGNEYQYLRRDENNVGQILNIISQGYMKDIVWTNETYSFDVLYEVFNNIYAGINLQYSNIEGHDAVSPVIIGEDRYDAQGYLDLYTPSFLQGKNITLGMNVSIGF